MARIGATIQVKGIVQGVGFRPFIHKQVKDHSLCGYIRNTSRGVEIEIEGEKERIDRFIEELWTHAPALALVQEVEPHFYTGLKNYGDFRILESQALPRRDTLISPDVGLCEDCRRELFDPQDRRYRYPFINCTNCGPRYTIVKDVPYDRPLTSMAPFPLCPDCEKEYRDIDDRRYHAQPVCCPKCGPVLEYMAASPEGFARQKGEEALEAAQALLRAGGILAVKGLGGFHLAVDAENKTAVLLLRQRKQRDQKPFAIMARNPDILRDICRLSAPEEKNLLAPERPIVLLKKKEPRAFDYLSENDRLGAMLPYTPLHELLLAEGPGLLVMTSANLSDQPIIKDNEEALDKLGGIADGFLLHQRDIVARCDDSLMWIAAEAPYFARRSRGFAPRPITLPETGEKTPRLLALGAEQKGGFALLKEEKVFLSPYIGDMKSGETLSHFEDTIRHYEQLFDCRPEALLCDMHPDYASALYAQKRAKEEGIPLLKVQHHHAHLAAVMADRGLRGPVLGLIWDGTGYGSDGTVWGGEFLLGDEKAFERAASLRPFPLPGGDLCAKELWRVGISLLTEAGAWGSGGSSPVLEAALSPVREKADMVSAQLAAGINSPLCSSMGRLFDGISSLLGLCREASYEGRGAVLLESAADPGEKGVLPYAIRQEDRLLLDERPLVLALLEGLKRGLSPSCLAARFMNTLVEMSLETACRLREEKGTNRVVLSGGSFQNMYLLERIIPRFQEAGFQIYAHRRVSCNDEGIPLGQLLAGRSQLQL